MMRKRYIALDILRALAGLCVPMLHLTESFWHGPGSGGCQRLFCGHVYYAVEFFLLLMGYMLGFAYDRRWREGMGTGDFFLRRLKRLHPVVISGVALGALVWLCQVLGVPHMQPIIPADTSAGMVTWGFVAQLLVIPAFGFTMIAPFNACSWTLYYEYLGNILYGTFVRRFGIRTLAVCAAAAFAYAVWFVFSHGAPYTFDGGWATVTRYSYSSGLARLLFPLFFGLLLFRLGWKIRLPRRTAMTVVTVGFLALLFVPYSIHLGAAGGRPWINGVLDLATMGVFMPLLLLIGVGVDAEPVEGRFARTVAFFAELSYPLYMSHYMFMSFHRGWLAGPARGLSDAAVVGVTVLYYFGFLLVAWAVISFWDRVMSAGRRKGEAKGGTGR